MPGAIVSPTQAKIDVALSQFARQYRNANMVGELLFPRVPVANQSDKYWKFGRENQMLLANVLRAPGAAAERILQTISTDNYNCLDHSLARLITDEERGNFQAGDIEQWATQAISDQILLDLENRIAALATTLANYGAASRVTLTGTAQWSDYTGSHPIRDVEAGKAQIRQTGQNANLLVLGDPVYTAVVNHPDIIDRLKYRGMDTVTPADLAAIFGVERVAVASAVQVSAAGTVSFLWGKHAVLAYCNPSATFADLSFGKMFVWTGAPGTSAGFSVEVARISPASAKADELAVHSYYDIKITGADAGYFIQNAVA